MLLQSYISSRGGDEPKAQQEGLSVVMSFGTIAAMTVVVLCWAAMHAPAGHVLISGRASRPTGQIG